MRKYRGLTKDGKWIYGCYVEYIFLGEQICSILNAAWDRGDYHPIQKRVIRVIPETVGQFTGLKDKKRTKEYPEGQEIYEGDIVEFNAGTKPRRVIIEFQVHCYNAGFYPSESANANCYWEIIGNICQNPELLEN